MCTSSLTAAASKSAPWCKARATESLLIKVKHGVAALVFYMQGTSSKLRVRVQKPPWRQSLQGVLLDPKLVLLLTRGVKHRARQRTVCDANAAQEIIETFECMWPQQTLGCMPVLG